MDKKVRAASHFINKKEKGYKLHIQKREKLKKAPLPYTSRHVLT